MSIMQRDGGKGRGRGQPNPQLQQEQHMQNLWQTLQQGSVPIAAVGGLTKEMLQGQGGKEGTSMQEMELHIKKMLNISAAKRNPLLDSSSESGGSGVKPSEQLRNLLVRTEKTTEPPRYSAVQDQTTHRLQVSPSSPSSLEMLKNTLFLGRGNVG